MRKTGIETCIDCPTVLTQVAGRGSARLRCDPCIRRYKNESRRAYRRGESYRTCLACSQRMPPASGFTYCEAHRQQVPVKIIREIICPTCCLVFETDIDTQQWCSELCRRRYKDAKRQRTHTYRPPTDADRARWKARAEAWKAAGRKRVRTGSAWRAVREQVLTEELDCWICGHPIDHSVRYPHPFYPTVDHVIQLAHGGAPYDRDNLRAAHFVCNNRRNARRFG